MKTNYCMPLFVLNLAGHLYCFTVPQSYLLKTDSLFTICDEKPRTFVGSFKDEKKNTIYFASTMKTFAYSIDTLEKHLVQVERYPEYFHFIDKSELIKDYNTSNKDVYFSVARGGLAKALYIGSLDSAVSSKNGNRKIYYNKNHDTALNRRYFEKEKGVWKVEFYEFNMFFDIHKIDENKSKVCLVGICSPKVWIPNWLFRLTAYFLYPSILSDFDNFLKREYSPSNCGHSR